MCVPPLSDEQSNEFYKNEDRIFDDKLIDRYKNYIDSKNIEFENSIKDLQERNNYLEKEVRKINDDNNTIKWNKLGIKLTLYVGVIITLLVYFNTRIDNTNTRIDNIYKHFLNNQQNLYLRSKF